MNPGNIDESAVDGDKSTTDDKAKDCGDKMFFVEMLRNARALDYTLSEESYDIINNELKRRARCYSDNLEYHPDFMSDAFIRSNIRFAPFKTTKFVKSHRDVLSCLCVRRSLIKLHDFARDYSAEISRLENRFASIINNLLEENRTDPESSKNDFFLVKGDFSASEIFMPHEKLFSISPEAVNINAKIKHKKSCLHSVNATIENLSEIVNQAQEISLFIDSELDVQRSL